MSETQEPPMPDDLGVIADPNSGERTATYELWRLGDSNEFEAQLASDIFNRIRSRQAGAEYSSLEDIKSKAQLAMAGLSDEKLQASPEPAQFIILGRKALYAVAVSYENPFATPPNLHQELHAAITEFTGEEDLITMRAGQD